MARKFVRIGDPNEINHTYLTDATTYALSDDDLNDAFEAEIGAVAAGTLLTKAGFSAIKQKDTDGSWVSL